MPFCCLPGPTSYPAPGAGNVCIVAQSCPALCDPMDYSPPDSLVHGDSLGQNGGGQGGFSCPPLGDLPNPEIKPRAPTLQAESLLSEPAGKSGAGNKQINRWWRIGKFDNKNKPTKSQSAFY